MSDSSSDEEENLNLRDALAPGFTIESVKKQLSEGQISAPSPGRAAQNVVKRTSSQYLAPAVTGDNQKYLAKELGKFLESQIKEGDVLKKTLTKKKKSANTEDTGVKLLSTSFVHLAPDQTEEDAETQQTTKKDIVRVKKRKLKDEPEEMDEAVKVKEAAVSVEWVLEKKGDYGPLCRKPGEVIQGAKQAWDTK